MLPRPSQEQRQSSTRGETLVVFLQEDVWRLEPEGEKEMPETRVADGVEAVSAEAETLVPRELVRQLTAGNIGKVPRVNVENNATATGTTVF